MANHVSTYLDSYSNSWLYKHLQGALLVSALALLIGSGLIAYFNIKHLTDYSRWVNHTHEVIYTLEEIDSDTHHVVASLRGFILTGAPAFEVDLHKAEVNLLAGYSKVLQLTKDNPAQQARLTQLKPVIDARIKLCDERITLRREQGFSAAVEAVNKFSGSNYVEQIHSDVGVMQVEEQKLLALRERAVGKANTMVFTALSIAALVGLAVMMLVLYGLRQQLSERSKNVQILRAYEAIIESSDDAIISKTLGGIIQSWNAGAQKMFGYTADEAIGQPMLMLIPDDKLNEEPEILAQIAQGNKVDHFETVRRHKDGHLIDISATISPIYDDNDRVVAASKIARDISERKLTEEKITKWAFYDTLTQLANRRLFYDRFNQAVATNKRSKQYGAVLLLDLDKFKTLNDQHGHAAGDQLLCEAALRIQHCVREADTVARFGGDEFLVLINYLRADKTESIVCAAVVAEKVRNALEQPYHLKVQGKDGTETMVEHQSAGTIGVAMFLGGEATAEDVIKQADAAMYQAKKNGRNQVSFYDAKA